MRVVLVAMGMMASLPAVAANGPWTPAPVPNASAPGVQPSARAGTAAGQTVDTPFSGLPQGSVAAGGATSSDVVNGVQTPSTSGK